MESNYYELTNPQKNILSLDQYYNDTSVNTICGYMNIENEVDFSLLTQSIKLLIDNNDAFRTTFCSNGNDYHQYFTSDIDDYNIRIVNVKDEKSLEKLKNKCASQALSLQNLFEFVIYKFPNNNGGVICSIHHIISDSWSLGLICKKIANYYYQLKNNLPIEKESVSYAKFIEEEFNYLNGDKYVKDEQFWKNEFDTIPDLPYINRIYKTNVVTNSSKALRKTFEISSIEMTKINEFCSKNRFSLFNFFMAIYSIYIANISNLDDFCIGTPILNRSNFNDKNTIGMFISTIPYRIKINPELDFTEFLKSITLKTMSIFRHQKYPYQSILKNLRRKNSKIPNLYNIALSYQITKTNTVSTNCNTEWIFNGNSGDNLQIHIEDYNESGNLKVLYDYKTEIFTDEDIDILHSRISNIIDQVLKNNTIRITDIQTITDFEKNEMIETFNNNKLPIPNNKTVVDLFEQNVLKNPNQIAVLSKTSKLTYCELNAKANQLANYFLASGLAEGDVVALSLSRNVSFVICIWAILKAGLIYLPICTDYPFQRINYILENSNAKIIISERKLENTNCPNIIFDDIGFSNFNSANLNLKYSWNNLCYLIYTSGSTGNPKGVMVTHKNLMNFLFSINANYNNQFSSKDIGISSANISFDASIIELFTPLVFGGTLALYPFNSLIDISYFCKLLEDWKVTFAYIPPSILLDVYNFIVRQKINCSLNKLFVGVEQIKNSTLNNYLKLNSEMIIVNGYGPTESTICTTFYQYHHNSDENAIVPIGKSVHNNTVLILNRFKNIMPKYTLGKIYIAGESVSKGYLNNKELTEKAFTHTKYSNDIWYCTGDLGYYDNEGLVHFFGRDDSQVKINGHRIELTEIDIALKKISGVLNSIIMIKKANNNSFIYAYVTLSQKNLTAIDIQNQLREFLPQYMIPSQIIILKEFPLNINGKVDRKKLPDVAIQEGKVVLPKTPTEKILFNILKKKLKIQLNSIDTSFSVLDIDSLEAIRFSIEIQNEFNLNVNINDIFKYNNIRALAQFIDTDALNRKKKNTSTIYVDNSYELYPLTSVQLGIYYAAKKAGEFNTLYNTPFAILFNKKVDAVKLQFAFEKIIELQSSFRTRFVMDNYTIKQQIMDNVDFRLKIGSDIPKKSINRVLSNFSKPFDLEHAPLLRAKINIVDDNSTLLLIDSHHIIMDGVSLTILLKDLVSIYNGQEIPQNQIQFKDFAIWENKYINSDDIKNDENYWLDRFNDFDFESLNLPYDYTIPPIRTYEGNKIHTGLAGEVFDNVDDFAKEHNLSPYVIFLAALYITLYKYTGQSDLVVGSPCSNRNQLETQSLIGMFVNNLCLRAKILPDQYILDLLNYLQKLIADDLSHQSYPYDLLVKKLNLPVDNSRNPIFDIVFTYQSQAKNYNLNNKNIQFFEINNNTSKFNMTIEVVPENKQLNIEYRTDIFKENTILSFIDHYKYVLKQILENTEEKVDNINIITPNEFLKLKEFNSTDSPIINKTASELFENVVEKQPNDIALICDDQTMTYKELNEKANSLAHFLVDNGIKSNDIVAIMTNRSFETIICMLAILKAGGAFLNVDPTYPVERTNYYIENSNIQYVLTQKSLRSKVAGVKNCINIDLGIESIYSKNKENLKIHSADSDLSYIIYTSGSTGQPKGVMLNQLGLSNMVQAMTKVLKYLKEGNKHTIVSVTSTPFDIFVYEIMVSITHGMRIVMATNSEHRNPKLLDALIKKHNVDVMTVTPSLMKINYDNREPKTALANVKNMVFGGEPLPEKFVKDLRALADDIKIYNIYGPSEITVLSNVQDLDGEKEITIGPPIMNTHIHILNNKMQELPIGVTGEIYISGIQVGDGYIGRKDLTDSRFLKNPFGPGKIYKSGDIGRWTFDGKVQCLGRIDNQVKLRGLRIELGEIENVLSSIDGITSSVVNKVEVGEKEVLCAYYVCDTDVTDKQVRDTLRQYLPPYMVPTYVMKLDRMPYTINRKIDRKALPLPHMYTTEKNSKINISELSTNEEKLLQIWKNILNIQDINLDDNFFDIGGDSISAIKMQIEALKYGLKFEYADIFNYPTIKQLSKKLPSPAERFMDNYDYSIVNNILSQNIETNLSSIKKYEIKNALLLGSTGYLGAHILHSYLKNESGDIYCVIRQKNNENIRTRLKNILNFYFGNDYFEQNENRIKLIEGDITQKGLGLNEKDLKTILINVNCVINSAALVKHYGLKDIFYSINVDGTNNIIDFCKKNNFRLLHISTISVSGFGEKEEIPKDGASEGSKVFSEKTLYVNQNLKGIYSITKFKAELAVLQAINEGLDAQILRMGNITNRYEDGVFQINYNDNAFARRLKSFIEIGAIPLEMLNHSVELTPVDLSADAVIKILENTSDCNVFHIYNSKLLSVEYLVNVLKTRGIKIQAVPDELMNFIISGLLSENNKKELISGIVQDIDSDKKLVYTSNVKLDSTFTDKYLNQIGFKWPTYDERYINKCMDYYKKIGFIG